MTIDSSYVECTFQYPCGCEVLRLVYIFRTGNRSFNTVWVWGGSYIIIFDRYVYSNISFNTREGVRWFSKFMKPYIRKLVSIPVRVWGGSSCIVLAFGTSKEVSIPVWVWGGSRKSVKNKIMTMSFNTRVGVRWFFT